MAKLCGKNTVAAMNKQVALQVETQASDGQGGYDAAWATYATVWASIAPSSGYEKFQAGQLQTPISHKLVIRYRSDISTLHRIIYDNRIFAIKEIINKNEDNCFQELKCLEKA